MNNNFYDDLLTLRAYIYIYMLSHKNMLKLTINFKVFLPRLQQLLSAGFFRSNEILSCWNLLCFLKLWFGWARAKLSTFFCVSVYVFSYWVIFALFIFVYGCVIVWETLIWGTAKIRGRVCFVFASLVFCFVFLSVSHLGDIFSYRFFLFLLFLTLSARMVTKLSRQVSRFKNSILFSEFGASGSSFAIAYYVLIAYDDAGRFYDWAWCDIGCRLSGCDALRGAGSAKLGACKHFRRYCTKNALDPASPPDQLYRQHASVFVPPPLQHINSLVWPRFLITKKKNRTKWWNEIKRKEN